MIRNLIRIAFAVVATVSSARAGMVVSLEQMVNPAGGGAASAFATDTGFNSGAPQQTWVSYALGIIPSGGEKVTTFDVTITTQLSGTSGFAQRWTLDADDPSSPSVPTPASVSVSTADSHLIVGGSIQFVAPSENKFDAGGPPLPADTLTRDYGVGTQLRGAWGFTPAEQATQIDGVPVRFAYLVMPRNAPLSMTVDVASSQNAAGYSFTQSLFPFGPLTGPPAVFDSDLGSIVVGQPVSATLPFNPYQSSPPPTWSLNSFVGPGGPVAGATVNPSTGLFSWNSAGAPLGNYSATIMGSHFGFGDTGVLSFNLVVPEPPTLALFSLALLGLIDSRRR